MKRKLIGIVFLACGIAFSCPRTKAQKAVVIHAGRLFDGTSDRLMSNQVIVIQGDRIAEVGPAGSVKIPVGAQEIDLGNATVLPGLIDAHSHVFKWRSESLEVQMRHDSQYRMVQALLNAQERRRGRFHGHARLWEHGRPLQRHGRPSRHQ